MSNRTVSIKIALVLVCFLLTALQTGWGQSSWKRIDGTEGIRISSISIYLNNPDTIYALGEGLHRSTNRGETWENRSNPSTLLGVVKVFPRNPNLLYAVWEDGQSKDLFLSSDGGQHWEHKLSSGGGPLAYPIFVEIDPIDQRTTYVSGPNLQRSADFGTTWSVVDTFSRNLAHSMKFSPSNPSFAYLAIDSGLYVTTDRCETWQRTLFPGEPMVLAIDPSRPEIVYASKYSSAGDTLFGSTDGGDSWRPLNNGMNLGTDKTMFVVINPLTRNELFVGGGRFGLKQFLYHSTDAGMHWENYWEGLPDSIAPTSFTFDTLNHIMYLGIRGFGSSGSGIYVRDLSTEVSDKTDEMLPASFSLFQNYPNPFNPRTTIAYELPEPSHVHLSVFTTLGEEISVLVNEEKNEGHHEVVFEDAGLPSGLYFYRLQAGAYTETRKLLLLK